MAAQDKKDNPSNYTMVTVSEGAQLIDGEIIETGKADAYGHKKLGGIGEIVVDAIEKLTGEHTIYQKLSYLMRTGAPDALDIMVAVNFANMAMTLIGQKASGRMVALRGGTYTNIPMSEITTGLKRVDVEEFYDSETYRPRVLNVIGKPMFLY